MIDRDRALAIQRRALRDFVRLLGSSSPGAEVLEADGFVAARAPACPERSLPNSVAYRDAAVLLERHAELVRFYEEAGIGAWTVFVPDSDRDTARALVERGHVLDSEPTAMTLELAEWRAPPLGDLDWDADADIAAFGPLNDLAWGLDPATGFGRAISAPTLESFRLYGARVGGELACVLGTLDHEGGDLEGGDLGFYFVATHPDHRTKGLAGGLVAAALGEARERGLLTASLQATKMGQPVYERLGFTADFKLEMYERRLPEDGVGQ